MLAAKMPLTKQLNVAIIDSNPSLQSGFGIKKEDLPDPRVSTVTPASIDLFKGVTFTLSVCYLELKTYYFCI